MRGMAPPLRGQGRASDSGPPSLQTMDFREIRLTDEGVRYVKRREDNPSGQHLVGASGLDKAAVEFIRSMELVSPGSLLTTSADTPGYSVDFSHPQRPSAFHLQWRRKRDPGGARRA